LDKGFKLVKKIPGVSYLKKGKKYLFWFMISEVLVHGCLVLLPLVCGKADYHAWKHLVEKTAHPMEIRKEREREREEKRGEEKRREIRREEKGAGIPIYPYTLLGHIPKDLTFFH
jgi:hypothetical protein